MALGHYGKWMPSEGESELRRFAALDPGLFSGQIVSAGRGRADTIFASGRKIERRKVRKGGLEPHWQSRFRNEFAGRVTWRPPETAWKRLPSLPPVTAIRRVEPPEEPLSPATWAPAEAWRHHADPDSVDGAAHHRTLKPKALTSVPKNAGQFAAPVGERPSSGHLTSRRSALRSVRSAMKSPR